MGSSVPDQDFFMLKWENYHDNIASSFQEMREEGDFLDTTVACDERHQLQAHKVILSASSPYFKTMLKHNPAQHPVLVMPPEVRYGDLLLVIQFIYHGEVRVPTNDINSFMKLVQTLKLKGLTEDQKSTNKQQQQQTTRMPPGTRMVRQGPDQQPQPADAKRQKAEPHFNPDESRDEENTSGGPIAGGYFGYSSGEPAISYETSPDSGGYGMAPPSGGAAATELGGSNASSVGGIQLKGLVCPICKAMCQDVNSLKEHMFIGHGIQRGDEDGGVGTSLKPQPKKSRKRPFSDQMAANQKTLAVDDESIACRFCDKKLKNPRSLLSHQKRLHRVELGLELEGQDEGIHEHGGDEDIMMPSTSHRYHQSGSCGKKPRGRGAGRGKKKVVADEDHGDMMVGDESFYEQEDENKHMLGGPATQEVMAAMPKPVVHVQPTSRQAKDVVGDFHDGRMMMSPPQSKLESSTVAPSTSSRNDTQIPRQKMVVQQRPPSAAQSPSRPVAVPGMAANGKSPGSVARKQPPTDLQSKLELKLGGQISITSTDNSFRKQQMTVAKGTSRSPQAMKTQENLRRSFGLVPQQEQKQLAGGSPKVIPRPATKNGPPQPPEGFQIKDEPLGEDDYEDDEELMEEEEDDEDEEEEYGQYAEDEEYYSQSHAGVGDIGSNRTGNLDGLYGTQEGGEEEQGGYEEEQYLEEEMQEKKLT